MVKYKLTNTARNSFPVIINRLRKGKNTNNCPEWLDTDYQRVMRQQVVKSRAVVNKCQCCICHFPKVTANNGAVTGCPCHVYSKKYLIEKILKLMG